jgi:GTP-binding protein EngB required for normal cell division
MGHLPVRLLIATLVSIGFALALFGLLYATDLAYSVWERLGEAPTALVAVYIAVIIALAGGAGWVLWRLLRPRPQRAGSKATRPAPPSPPELGARIAKAAAQGADTGAAQVELARLSQGPLCIALFGEVSSGKSSLVQALLPGARVDIDPRAGTTRTISHYGWRAPTGEEVELVDLPGCNDPSGDLEPASRDEALRAHAVVYLTDQDLTRRQHREIQALLALDKPVIVALNKMDRYSEADVRALRARIAERVPGCEAVALSAGGHREVVRTWATDREEVSIEPVPAKVGELLAALARTLGRDRTALLRGRDAVVLGLASRKLETSLAAHRRARAEEIVRDYARQAVLGALVAVTPGTDLIIQGYLAMGMLRALGELYEVSAPRVEIARLLRLATHQARKALPVVLAVAGNAFKAFPGLGTVAGGALHAVGYGLVFESLGRAVAENLARAGGLAEQATLERFEEDLSEDLETRARRLVRLALAPERRGEP